MAFREKEQRRIGVNEEVDVLRARRAGREMAFATGFDDVESTEIEIAISELGMNIIKHGGVRGEIVLTLVQDEGSLQGIEIVARDHGPGIADPASALRGGESTAGTLGIGLSGVKRLMDDFTLNSEPGTGTVVKTHKWLEDARRSAVNFSVLSRPKPGEEVSGDAYLIRPVHGGFFFSVIDALGHGPEANKTVTAALAILQRSFKEDLLEIAANCHRGLRTTRGVAIGMCRIKEQEGIVSHLSIGNVELRIFREEQEKHTICFNGTLGMETEQYQVKEYPWDDRTTLIMFSDGISGKFKLSPYLLAKPPIEITSYLLRNYSRGYDDATVLVVK